MQGIIKWYDEVKGFGFIQTDEEKDVFVHRTGIKDSSKALETGQKVEFDVEPGEKGPIAKNVIAI